ncbi:golgin subfamily A member 6-like protein 22 [Temnothorax curvispinosus]|uniref:Golgin subfamily A member 6-like protein 22 n=1 Tax=Temnothorax curvispinosus TaxID=300111 RepID=A0A6J1PU63_9HYME|nr:golgin subfamily A member 6-like protein 22 [Temnothorax curvispinosus]
MFLEREFGARAGVKKMRSPGRVGGEIIIVEMDCWEAKDNIMKEKKKLGSKKIFINHDLTFEDREVQRRRKERAWKKKTEGKWVKIGFRKLEIQVYNVGTKKDVEEIMAKITEQCEGCEGEDIIIGGDFNIRIGNLGGCREEEYDFEKESKDKVIEDGGRSFVDMINEKGYAQERVLEFRIGDRVDLDHLPLTLLLEEEENTRQIEGCTEEEEEERNMSKKIIVWNEEARQLYRERTEVWNETEDQEMESKLYQKEEGGEKKVQKVEMWKGSKEDYLEEKKCLKGWLERKRMEKRVRDEEELRKLKDEKKIWNYINSRRKKKEWKENNVPKEN